MQSSLTINVFECSIGKFGSFLVILLVKTVIKETGNGWKMRGVGLRFGYNPNQITGHLHISSTSECWSTH